MKNKDNLDISFIEGKKDLPLVIFIHGLGMDKKIWTEPEHSTVMAGRYPLSILLHKKASSRTVDHKPAGLEKITTGEPPKRLVSVLHHFSDHGYNVLAWSQKRPSSYASLAVDELRYVVRKYSGQSGNGLILVGHSRGGLIAKSFALSNPDTIRAVIAIGTPFNGSSLARWANVISGTLSHITPLFNSTERGTAKNTLKHILDFINSLAVKELLPRSEFLDSLRSTLPQHIRSLSIAGSSPDLFRIYKWHIDCIDKSNTYKLRPKLLFSFPGSIKRYLPDMIIPDELTKGKGDGLVSVNSALFATTGRQERYPDNHAGLLFSRKVRNDILSFVSQEVR